MSAVIILILRAMAALILYVCLGFIIVILWKDLFGKKNSFETQMGVILAIKILNSDEIFDFSSKEVFIGRSELAQIQIVDDDAVSNMHARVFFKRNNWWVEDLQSTNGTLINGDALEIPTVISTNDLITCGNSVVEINIKNRPDIPAI